MNTTSTFQGIPESISKTSNASTFIFEDLKYFDCTVNSKTLRACIYAHEMLLQNFGFWVWFSNGSNFLTFMDLNSSKWVTLAPEGDMYADAIQTNIEAFFRITMINYVHFVLIRELEKNDILKPL